MKIPGDCGQRWRGRAHGWHRCVCKDRSLVNTSLFPVLLNNSILTLCQVWSKSYFPLLQWIRRYYLWAASLLPLRWCSSRWRPATWWSGRARTLSQVRTSSLAKLVRHIVEGYPDINHWFHSLEHGQMRGNREWTEQILYRIYFQTGVLSRYISKWGCFADISENIYIFRRECGRNRGGHHHLPSLQVSNSPLKQLRKPGCQRYIQIQRYLQRYIQRYIPIQPSSQTT